MVLRQAEAARRKLLADEQTRRALNEKLKRIGKCEAGYDWVRTGSGYTCSAGGHSVTDAQLSRL